MSLEKEINQDLQVLRSIQQGDQKVLQSLYDQNRKNFIAWSVQSYQCDEEEAIEIFQKAFTILYFNIRNGKLTELTSSLKTYLFSVGKNLFRERLRDKNNHTLNIDDLSHSPEIQSKVDSSILDAYQQEHHKAVVRKLLAEIGDPCKKLLELVYIKGYSTEAVVDEMGYSDERVVRKRKSLCLKQLREMAADPKNNNIL
jgi:RNA polymerase sigma factor (sigma-70 family)